MEYLVKCKLNHIHILKNIGLLKVYVKFFSDDSHPAIDLSDFPILSSRSSATPNPMPSTRNYGESCYFYHS